MRWWRRWRLKRLSQPGCRCDYVRGSMAQRLHQQFLRLPRRGEWARHAGHRFGRRYSYQDRCSVKPIRGQGLAASMGEENLLQEFGWRRQNIRAVSLGFFHEGLRLDFVQFALHMLDFGCHRFGFGFRVRGRGKGCRVCCFQLRNRLLAPVDTSLKRRNASRQGLGFVELSA